MIEVRGGLHGPTLGTSEEEPHVYSFLQQLCSLPTSSSLCWESPDFAVLVPRLPVLEPAGLTGQGAGTFCFVPALWRTGSVGLNK